MATRLFVYGVNRNCPKNKLYDAFGQSGQVEDVYITDRGFAFVTMSSKAEADDAIHQLNNTEVDGQNIEVNVATPLEGGGNRGGGGGFRGGRGRGGGRGYGRDRGGDRDRGYDRDDRDRGYGGDRGYNRDRGGDRRDRDNYSRDGGYGGGRGGGRRSDRGGEVNKLFVYGVDQNCPVDVLRDEFEKIGQVDDVFITGKGFAFVTMGSKEEAEDAMRELNGVEVDGQEIRVDRAKPRGDRDGGRRGYRDDY